jgi:cobyrinic acid a,c-diamide synthase
MQSLAPGFLISAIRSGSGKTVTTLGLQRAFARRGLRVAAVKAGPDYIDPAFHAAACGGVSLNLDAVAMSREILLANAAHAAKDADIVVGEGAMGLFDGLARDERNGSSAEVARMLGWPVVLVVDVSGAAQTVAALCHGLAEFPGAPRIAGLICNRVASPRHMEMIAAGLRKISLPLLGGLPTDKRLELPSRHLGLVQAVETDRLNERLEGFADVIAEHIDLDALLKIAQPTQAQSAGPALRPPGQRIAVARDEAFAFMYPHLLKDWREAGSDILFFSPLTDEGPHNDADVCWLPGGYPELHAARLASNQTFLKQTRAFAASRPIHGECGGYMVLGETIEDAGSDTFPMLDLLPLQTSFAQRKLNLGYRQVCWRADMPFCDARTPCIGHEFHYATILSAKGTPLADMKDGLGNPLGPAGTRVGHVTGSFFHIIAEQA